MVGDNLIEVFNQEIHACAEDFLEQARIKGDSWKFLNLADLRGKAEPHWDKLKKMIADPDSSLYDIRLESAKVINYLIMTMNIARRLQENGIE